ncbi:M16 family metallopeptidase, partial [Stenotrophomonas maltophilia]
GDEAAISGLTREDLVDFHHDWLRPQNGTLIVVGDTTLAEIVPLLDKQLGDWKAAGDAPQVKVATDVALPKAPRVFLIDQPGAVQANLFAGQLVAPSSATSSTCFDIANEVIGGDFTSRLNMNLREDKHWTYGANSMVSETTGQRAWMATASVQIDKTAPALAEMIQEITAFTEGSKPATAAEIHRIRNTQTLSLPGAYETAAAVASAIGSMVQFRLPDDYVLQRKADIEEMTLAQVQEAAAEIKPQALTWLVVGDLKHIEAAVRALSVGHVTVIDAEGNLVAK